MGDRSSLILVFKIREGVKKTFFFGTSSQTMGRWGSKVPNFLVKTTIQKSPKKRVFLGHLPLGKFPLSASSLWYGVIVKEDVSHL